MDLQLDFCRLGGTDFVAGFVSYSIGYSAALYEFYNISPEHVIVRRIGDGSILSPLY
jgi:hypothetical protein